MTESAITEDDDVEPELCRVSVVGGNTQVDIALPAAVPIGAYIADVVDLVLSRNPPPVDDEASELDGGHWTLARLGRDAIATTRSLNEADICDGDLLVLRAVDSRELPALFDDVIDAVARLTESGFRGWSATAAGWTGMIAAVAAVCVEIGLLLGARAGTDTSAQAWVAVGGGFVALGAAVVAARVYRADAPAATLSVCGCGLICAGAALFVPGAPGAPHAMLGGAVTVVVAVGCHRISGAGATVLAAVVTVAAIGSAAAAAAMIWHPGPAKLGAAVAVAALCLITPIPRLAAALARIPVPPVPTAGAPVDPADDDPRPTIEGIGAVGATVLPSAAGLHRRAGAATRYQSGMLLGVTVVAVLGALAALVSPGSIRWSSVSLAVVIGIVLCLRGRAFADSKQAAALIGGGAVVLLAVPVALGLAAESLRLPGAGLCTAYAAVALGLGVIGPTRELTPTARRAGEIVEYLLICSIVPLTLWTLELYELARDI
ncbi:type VII secretion integral membrane protein EccD [Nocardia sp. NBC_00416]|uniref:type VII secretion integral membrane protein EccD n=1 Tax=Nocardia sp. NBC_00416 TaxID=2975991 RepID=UPI002E1B34F8